jgi:ribosomal-protein-alanine N-acetyltransferase
MRRFSGRAGRSVGVESKRARGMTSARKLRAEDVDAVIAIVGESPEAAIWSAASYTKFAEEDGALALVIETDGEISAFLVGRRIGDQAEVLNLAVATRHRHKAQGTALLTEALEEWRSGGGKSVYLEVRESNTGAIAFYERHGFTKMGQRKGYYREPDEAAVTMEKKLTASIG